MREKHKLLLPYLIPMMRASVFSPQAKNALVFGLGGGSMVHYLQYYHPELSITVIEKEPTIVTIAQELFSVVQKPNRLSIKILDAFNFVKTAPKKFDLIFVDIFSPHLSPSIQNPTEFYTACASCLSTNGTIAFNSVCSKIEDVDFVLSTIRKLFPQKTIAVPVDDHLNLVVIGSRNNDFEREVRQLCQDNKLLIQHNSPNYGLIVKL